VRSPNDALQKRFFSISTSMITLTDQQVEPEFFGTLAFQQRVLMGITENFLDQRVATLLVRRVSSKT
jgi:hypothetical protein